VVRIPWQSLEISSETFWRKWFRAVESEDAKETEALRSAAEQGQAGTTRTFATKIF